jgi:sugar lactone lactonase YvrE
MGTREATSTREATGTKEAEAAPGESPTAPTTSPTTPAEALIEEAKRRHRRRRCWWFASLLALALALAVGTRLLAPGGGGGATPARHQQYKTKVMARQPSPPKPTPSSVVLNNPDAVAMAGDGTVLIANEGTSQILRYVSSTRQLQVVAGNGVAGFSGDGGPAIDAELRGPSGLAVAPDGTIYVADSVNKRIRAIAPDGTISTVAGDGGVETTGDGPALDTAIATPQALALAPDGSLYFTDGSSVWKMSPSGTITTELPYNDTPLPFGDFSPDLQLETNALAVNSSGDIYLSDWDTVPKTIDEFSPTGRFIMAWVNRTGCLSTAANGELIVCSPNGPVSKITGPGLTAGMTTQSAAGVGLTDVTSDPDLGLPGLVAASATASADGEVYAVSGGGNGFSATSGLISVDPDGHVHELATGAPPSRH